MCGDQFFRADPATLGRDHVDQPTLMLASYLYFQEIGRILKHSGISMIQMLSISGVRNLYHQLKKGFRRSGVFDVTYWRPGDLREVFTRYIGPTELDVDGFFSANAQASDIQFLPFKYKLVVYGSEFLRRINENVKWMTHFADSLYVNSVRQVGKKYSQHVSSL